MRVCVSSLLKAKSERLIYCFDAIQEKVVAIHMILLSNVFEKWKNMLDICSANSYQQCSRSTWFSGFLRIHHSHLTCVLSYLEIGCCSVLRQSESIAEVNCSLSKPVMLLFSMERLFQRA